MDCIGQLTETEHTALRSLSKARNRNTFVVKKGMLTSVIPVVDLDALIEVGCIERLDGGNYRVLDPCPGHALLPGIPQKELRSSERANYICSADVDEPNRVVVGSRLPVIDSDDARIDKVVGQGRAGGSGTPLDNTAPAPRKGGVSGLLVHFDESARLHHWGSKLTVDGRKALGSNMKRWMGDGATADEIHWMIDHFFEELSAKESPNNKGPHLWRMFITRRYVLSKRYQNHQQSKAAEEHDDDPEYWAGTSPVQKRNRAR